MQEVAATVGKVKLVALVRDSEGGIVVDDWEALAPEVKFAIEEELKNGGHLSNRERS